MMNFGLQPQNNNLPHFQIKRIRLVGVERLVCPHNRFHIDNIDQLGLLFANSTKKLSSFQIHLLKAVLAGEKQLTAKETLEKYRLGTSANLFDKFSHFFLFSTTPSDDALSLL